MQQKFSVMVARFPGEDAEHPASSDYFWQLVHKIEKDERVSKVVPWRLSTTPIPMARNKAVEDAITAGCDFLIMLDNDMQPDTNSVVDGYANRSEKPFWDSSFDFAVNRWHEAPTVIAAPYVGPAPKENIYVFLWRTMETDSPEPVYYIDQFRREEAAMRSGIEEVCALPTGLILFDMRIFTGFTHPLTKEVIKLHRPYFYYTYREDAVYDELGNIIDGCSESEKTGTEDAIMTRDVSWLFGGHGLQTVFVNWDSWAVHWKLKPCGKPFVPTIDNVSRKFVETIQRNQRVADRVVSVTPGERSIAARLLEYRPKYEVRFSGNGFLEPTRC